MNADLKAQATPQRYLTNPRATARAVNVALNGVNAVSCPR